MVLVETSRVLRVRRPYLIGLVQAGDILPPAPHQIPAEGRPCLPSHRSPSVPSSPSLSRQLRSPAEAAWLPSDPGRRPSAFPQIAASVPSRASPPSAGRRPSPRRIPAITLVSCPPYGFSSFSLKVYYVTSLRHQI